MVRLANRRFIRSDVNAISESKVNTTPKPIVIDLSLEKEQDWHTVGNKSKLNVSRKSYASVVATSGSPVVVGNRYKALASSSESEAKDPAPKSVVIIGDSNVRRLGGPHGPVKSKMSSVHKDSVKLSSFSG